MRHRPNRKLRYTISNIGYTRSRYAPDGTLRGFRNFEQARTLAAAIRKARWMGPGTEIEQVFLTGKHKRSCRCFIWRGAASTSPRGASIEVTE